MELTLRVDEVVGDESEALLRWLIEERALRGQARLSRNSGSPPALGAMGDVLEIVNVVLSNSIALSSLLTSLVAWRHSRPAPAPTVRIEANGVLVTVDRDDPAVVRALVEELRAVDSAAGPGADDSDGTPGSGG